MPKAYVFTASALTLRGWSIAPSTWTARITFIRYFIKNIWSQLFQLNSYNYNKLFHLLLKFPKLQHFKWCGIDILLLGGHAYFLPLNQGDLTPLYLHARSPQLIILILHWAWIFLLGHIQIWKPTLEGSLWQKVRTIWGGLQWFYDQHWQTMDMGFGGRGQSCLFELF